MVKLGAIPKCGWRSGRWIWTDGETGEEVSSIGYVANTQDPQNMTLRVYYTVTDTQEKFDYTIRLAATHPPYGGKRLWFICPYSGRRVGRLYRPYGGPGYGSRHAYRLAYAS